MTDIRKTFNRIQRELKNSEGETNRVFEEKRVEAKEMRLERLLRLLCYVTWLAIGFGFGWIAKGVLM